MKRRSFITALLGLPLAGKVAADALSEPPAPSRVTTFDLGRGGGPRLVISGDGKVFVRGDVVIDGSLSGFVVEADKFVAT